MVVAKINYIGNLCTFWIECEAVQYCNLKSKTEEVYATAYRKYYLSNHVYLSYRISSREWKRLGESSFSASAHSGVKYKKVKFRGSALFAMKRSVE